MSKDKIPKGKCFSELTPLINEIITKGETIKKYTVKKHKDFIDILNDLLNKYSPKFESDEFVNLNCLKEYIFAKKQYKWTIGREEITKEFLIQLKSRTTNTLKRIYDFLPSKIINEIDEFNFDEKDVSNKIKRLKNLFADAINEHIIENDKFYDKEVFKNEDFSTDVQNLIDKKNLNDKEINKLNYLIILEQSHEYLKLIKNLISMSTVRRYFKNLSIKPKNGRYVLSSSFKKRFIPRKINFIKSPNLIYIKNNTNTNTIHFINSLKEEFSDININTLHDDNGFLLILPSTEHLKEIIKSLEKQFINENQNEDQN